MTAIAALCTSENVGPGLRRGDAGLLGLEHRLVDPPLGVGEGAVDRQRAGDVGGVEGVQLDAGVEQQQVAVAQVAVVADPVQGAGVVAGGGDGVVADGVADVPGVQAEDALDPALAAAAADGFGQVGDDGGEAVGGLGAGRAHLLDLEGVLGQPQLAQGDQPSSASRSVGWSRAALGLLAAELVDQHRRQLGVQVARQHPERRGVGVLAQLVGQARRCRRRRCRTSALISSSEGRRPTHISP